MAHATSQTHDSKPCACLSAPQVDPSAGADYAELQVHLYADYAPQLLADFLAGSQSYPLESALEICEARGLVDEQVGVCMMACSMMFGGCILMGVQGEHSAARGIGCRSQCSRCKFVWYMHTASIS